MNDVGRIDNKVKVKSGIAALREERARVQAFAFGLFSSTKMLEALRAKVSQVRTHCLSFTSGHLRD